MSYDREKYATAYVEAIGEVVKIEEGKEFIDQLTELNQVMLENPELETAFRSRRLPQAIEKDLVTTLCQGYKSVVQSFFLVLVQNGHIMILDRICAKFIEFQNERQKLMVFKAVVTYLPDNLQQQKLEEVLKNKFDLNEVQINYQIDKDLVGGIIIESNTYLIDDSVRTRLNRVRDSLFQMKINSKELEA
ncbi:ATP synthase F1 subunit delta [Xylocopilactobacillus apicola]|uniref:ATP synthase subunit delta n=1 Tax=Xylocopilactobacillus apicola TaxID=2932184 RepID=A0AAU9DMQ1_9LACO|nr:ATP synthase F1 subunit delta [Xylocopilactobacillus apicola]BDR58272.1 ATP synthase subunit delta [Xylocopilactobacillus apicola]